MTHFTESTIEETALEWLKDMGYTIVFGNDIAPENALASLRAVMLLEVAIKGQPLLTGGRRPGDAIFGGDVLIIQRKSALEFLAHLFYNSCMHLKLKSLQNTEALGIGHLFRFEQL